MNGKGPEDRRPAVNKCAAGTPPGMLEEKQALDARLGRIKHKMVVLSGKGGVGKSSTAVNLACSLARRGLKTGILDVDIHGPNVPKLLGIEGRTIGVEGESMLPFQWSPNLKVMSISFLLRERHTAVIWRGPLKMGAIKQFLKDVKWGDLDWLVVDAPPGTGDEPLSVLQLIEEMDGCVIVTTPQELALLDVEKCITFCEQVERPILGLVENMTHVVCPDCGGRIEMFGPTGGARELAERRGVRYLGEVPFEPLVARLADQGKPAVEAAPDSQVSAAFQKIAEHILQLVEEK